MTTRGRLQIDAAEFNGLTPSSYSRAQPHRKRGDKQPCQDNGVTRFQNEMNAAQEWQEGPYDADSPVYTRMLAETTPRNFEEGKQVENTDTSRDGESSGNSLEAQQWSDSVSYGCGFAWRREVAKTLVG